MPYYDEPGARWDDPLLRYDDPRTYQEILNSQNKPMFDVILDIHDLSVPDLIQRAKNIKSGVAGQAVFAGLSAQLTTLGTTIGDLEELQTRQEAARTAFSSATDLRDDGVDLLKAQLKELGVDIGKAAVTEEQIHDAQLRVPTPAGPKPVPSQPTGLELSVGDEEGELSGQCNGQPGAVEFYEIEWTTADPNSATPGWQRTDAARKSRFDMAGLPSGQKVWVHIRASNARGKSPWSDPACKRVP